jgi:hypothetical protein
VRLPLQLRRQELKRRARGQALVLGALSFLVLALMVTLSFNLSQALRAKVSLQQHSDTLAYSMAVMEARALNYYAVTNRSIAASYVAMNSLQAYMAAASVTGPMMHAGSSNFSFIATQEAALCAATRDTSHCKHAIEARKIANTYSRTGRDYETRAQQLDGKFQAAMQALDAMVDTLHASQRRVHERTRVAVSDGTSYGLRQLATYNAPGVSSLPFKVGSINANEFNCAVDGFDCTGGVASSSPKTRAQVMTEIANATRPGWPASRAGLIQAGTPQYLHPAFLKQLVKTIPGSGYHYVMQHQGTAKTVKNVGSLHGGGQLPGNTGTTVAAHEHGSMYNLWNHGLGTSGYKAQLHGDAAGGGHTPHRAHSCSHHFDGVNAKAFETCTARGNCFMKFRANPSPACDWGQPRVYSYVTWSLRAGDPQKAPWELNPSAALAVNHGAQGTATLALAPEQGAGLSKALVYYHRFDEQDWKSNGRGAVGAGEGWREAPNLFAPYWRAKLHPFTSEQAHQVLQAVGNTDAAEIVLGSPELAL